MRKLLAGIALGCMLLPGLAAAATLDEVRARGSVRCAIDGTAGFGGLGQDGRPSGLDVEFCRAVAAATLGDADAVELERINTANKFGALARGEIDIAFGMATGTLRRDATMGVRFVTPIFHDGQALMVWADGAINRLGDARGRRVCVQGGTTSADNLDDVSRQYDLELTLVTTGSSEERLNRFLRRECELISGDRAELASLRATRTPDPARWRILDETLSREPLGPYVAAADEQWFTIVRWVINATLVAEVHGLTAARVGQVGDGAPAEVRLLGGRSEDDSSLPGLSPRWALNVVSQVGNYAQIFERTVGRDSPLRLERGHNRLWRDGGLFFPPPLR